MTKYFFTTTMLPPLRIGEPPVLSFGEFKTLVNENLLPHDLDKIKTVQSFYDILNIRAFWKGDEFDPYGNLNENQLEEAVLDHVDLPPYVLKFLDDYKTKEERLKHFPMLISEYFKEETQNVDPFLKDYFNFWRHFQLVLVGFRAKKLKRNLLEELQFEDPNDDFVAQILAQKDAPVFEPPEGFEDLKAIFEAYQDKPIKLYQALSEYRFQKIEELSGSDQFSFSKILSYMLELIMAEKWMELDEKRGLEIINKILEKSTK